MNMFSYIFFGVLLCYLWCFHLKLIFGTYWLSAFVTAYSKRFCVLKKFFKPNQPWQSVGWQISQRDHPYVLTCISYKPQRALQTQSHGLLPGLFSPFIFNVIPEAVALVHHRTMLSCPLPPPAPFIYSLFKNFFHCISLLLLNYTSVYHSFDRYSKD